MTERKATIQRLGTGVPGLDEVLGGGKTTLAHQIMFALSTRERPALYFTVLGEPPLKMLRYQQQFEFFDTEQVNASVRFINLADDIVSGDLDRVLARIVAELKAAGPAAVFVDSFRSVMLAGQSDDRSFMGLQQFIQQLGMLMTSWQATTFLIGEYFDEFDSNPVFTVADGLIWLRQSLQSNSVVRKMEIMKMRGQRTLPGLHTFRIGSAGIQVFAPVADPGAAATPIDTRAPDLSVDEVARLLITEIRRLQASRVVIDSLSGFELALAPTFRNDFRESVSRLVWSLAATGVSVLMTSELEDRYTDLRFSPYGTAFMTDAITVQRYIELDSRLRRIMGVVKVRASAHSNELRLFHIDDQGIRIGGMVSGLEGLLGGQPSREQYQDDPGAGPLSGPDDDADDDG
jgi:KaiC/GvpD/RAD55 family RecA-like ATPase